MSIKSLDPSTVHRICSGQVIINLANAVKELIENSLDAGAKTVEIKLKQYGSELIEVIDDGPGIDESEFQAIALKHYTSKIKKYEDLESLETFGFRGEALSSLCALANLVIITRNGNSQVGTRIEYDKNGLIKSKTSCARSIGTTVQLERLFHTLPVRHKEFLKNLKKEFNKLMHVIQCYCLISAGVKMSCFHIISEKSTKLMSTHTKNSLKENIIEIFGLSSMTNMVKFEQIEPDEQTLVEFKLKTPSATSNNKNVDEDFSQSSNESTLDSATPEAQTNYAEIFQIEGFISSCSHGMGRSAPDRQYIYVNKRPCDHLKITKLINEVYHQFNRNQYPMYILNINMNSHDVDVNVTPDKLVMFIKNENILLALIKTSLLKIYGGLIKNLNLNDSSLQNTSKSSELMLSFFSSKPKSQPKLSEVPQYEEVDNEKASRTGTDSIQKVSESKKRTNNEIEEEFDDQEAQERQQQTSKKILITSSENNIGFTLIAPKSPLPNRVISYASKDSPIESRTPDSKRELTRQPLTPKNTCSDNKKQTVITENFKLKPQFDLHVVKENNAVDKSPFSVNEKMNFFQSRIGSTVSLAQNENLNDSLGEKLALHMCNRETHALDTPPTNRIRMQDNLKSLGYRPNDTDHDLSTYDSSILSSPTNNKEATNALKDSDVKKSLGDELDVSSVVNDTLSTQSSQSTIKESQSQDKISSSMASRKVKELKFDLNKIKQKHGEMIQQNEVEMRKREENVKSALRNLKFKTRNIDSRDAENELDRCIVKEDFLKMKVCGQFNKGFIITQLEQDLFIIDQHAADEIYNFETFQKNGKIEKQKLLQPKFLELSASAESILIDNVHLLEKTGYEVQVCSNRRVGNRIMVSSVPMAKQSNKLLNLKDIDEILFILSESELNPGSISLSSSEQSNITEIKSSSLRKIYASKACRKAVMIGDSLNSKEMRRIVDHLNEIDKPWNCPHGRPTMRHLINLDLLRNLKI